LPKYNGTIHPEEWLKQIQTLCYLKGIENEQKIFKICKLMIDSTITIPNEINSLGELIKALKSHSTFKIYKDTCRKKLKFLRYTSEKDGGNTATFLANFRSLCNDAEINDPKEIKNLLFNNYSSSKFFQIEFTKKVNDINSVDEIFEIFNNVGFDESKIIKHGSLVTLKHITTGGYLSSCKINYQTGSRTQLVSIFLFNLTEFF